LNTTVIAVPGRRHGALARCLPFIVYISFLAAAPLIGRAFPSADPRWLYAIQIGAASLALVFFWRHYVELRVEPGRGQRLSPLQWAASVGAGAAVFVLWVSLDLPWARLGEADAGFDARDAAGRIDWALAAVRLFGAAIVVPVMEELFWRSFIMRWIDRADFLAQAPAAVGLRALAVSSLVFGIEHNLWLAGIIAGLAYGWLYIRTGSLWAPILAHAVTNLMLGVWVLATGQWHFW
jgi:CAAX prenyl protease-like protein